MLIGLVRDSVLQCFCHSCKAPLTFVGESSGKSAKNRNFATNFAYRFWTNFQFFHKKNKFVFSLKYGINSNFWFLILWFFRGFLIFRWGHFVLCELGMILLKDGVTKGKVELKWIIQYRHVESLPCLKVSGLIFFAESMYFYEPHAGTRFPFGAVVRSIGDAGVITICSWINASFLFCCFVIISAVHLAQLTQFLSFFSFWQLPNFDKKIAILKKYN